jgi:hypothetical protein
MQAFEGAAALISDEFNSTDLFVEPADSRSAAMLLPIGQFAWSVIQDNRPVANLAGKHVSILNKRDKNFASYSGWRSLTSPLRNIVTARSPFGFVSHKVDMRLVFQWNGRYRNTAGRYLKNCYAAPSVHIVIGNYLDGQATRARNPVNIGSVSNPCAQIDIHYKLTYGSLIERFSTEWRFRFACNGKYSMTPLG